MSRNSIRAVAARDLAELGRLGLNKTTVLRAMAQDMAWLIDEAGVRAGATARLVDGGVPVDDLVGDDCDRLALISHIIGYARWTFAPILLVPRSAHPELVEKHGFVGLEAQRLPNELSDVASAQPLLMKQL